MTTPTTPEPRFVVKHDTERHSWQIIDREGSKGQYAAVIGEMDDRYHASKVVIERYCRELNAAEGEKASE